MHARNGERYAVRREAAWALRSSARRQKYLAEIMGVDQSTVSRYCSGEVESAVAACYDVVRRLAADSRSEAGHVIAGMMSVAQEVVSGMEPAKVLACLDMAQDRETEAQQAEDRAQLRVLRAIASVSAERATPDDFGELADAIAEHDEAIRHENAAHNVVLYFARGYLAQAGRRS